MSANLQRLALLQRVQLRQPEDELDLVTVRRGASLALGRPLARDAVAMFGKPTRPSRLIESCVRKLMVGDHQRAPWLQVPIGALQRLTIVIAPAAKAK